MIEDYQLNAGIPGLGSNLLNLAFTGEGSRVRTPALAFDQRKYGDTGTLSQKFKLDCTFTKIAFAKVQRDEDRGLSAFRAIKHRSRNAAGAPAGQQSAIGLSFRRMFEWNIDRARGNDSRDGVLVHHLGDRVLKQDDILIERL